MRPPGYMRLMLHILLLAAVTTFAVKELLTLVGGSGDGAGTILMSGFGLAVGLGVLSLVSLFVMRAMHHMVSTMFFGVTLLVMLLSMFSELLMVAW